jgi:hypothetical protein
VQDGIPWCLGPSCKLNLEGWILVAEHGEAAAYRREGQVTSLMMSHPFLLL